MYRNASTAVHPTVVIRAIASSREQCPAILRCCCYRHRYQHSFCPPVITSSSIVTLASSTFLRSSDAAVAAAIVAVRGRSLIARRVNLTNQATPSTSLPERLDKFLAFIIGRRFHFTCLRSHTGITLLTMVVSNILTRSTLLDYKDRLLYTGGEGEQREVYGAAMVIQRAYREYRARNTSRRQADAERRAAVTIQSCYRRYKQFCYFKKLHNAAIVVQKHFRLKKMNQSELPSCPSTEVPEHPTLNGQSIRIQVPQNSSSLLREHRAATTIQLAYRGHRKRQAAARKIQKFMKESRMKLRKIQELSDGGLGADLRITPSSNPSPDTVTATHMTRVQIGISSLSNSMMDVSGSR
ncbi:hypothetical protein GCK32_011959 [Trichostrongylus colubriformis]|uniref:Uncharacterized protein n=1 Tax=Trichostrongylus colubriformis TaxID=6319 RepID=A0AAN8FAD8_TRICO